MSAATNLDPQPGITDEFTNEQYHAAPGISKSGLTLILKSPAKYWDRYLNPEREPQVQTRPMLIGSIAHKLLFEPDEFFDEYAVEPNVDRRTKAGKAALAEFAEQCEGKTPISEADLAAVKPMTDAALAHPTVAKLVRTGKPEQSIFWEDSETGVLCKCRPDYLRDEVIIDYKTCMDAAAGAFGRDCFKFGYHIQDSFYREGVLRATGADLQFLFIAQEKESPHLLATYSLDQDAKDLGTRMYRSALRIYAECLERDRWPGLPEQVQRLSLPAWSFKQENDS